MGKFRVISVLLYAIFFLTGGFWFVLLFVPLYYLSRWWDKNPEQTLQVVILLGLALTNPS